MNNNSDPMFDRYADMDFSDAKPVSDVPALAKLQAEQGGKSRITIRIDNDTLAIFPRSDLADVLREIIRQELHRT